MMISFLHNWATFPIFIFIKWKKWQTYHLIKKKKKKSLPTMNLFVVICYNLQFWLFRLMRRKWLRVTQIFRCRSPISIIVLIRWNNFLTVTTTIISDLFRHIMQYLECDLICLFFNSAICFLNFLSLWVNMCLFLIVYFTFTYWSRSMVIENESILFCLWDTFWFLLNVSLFNVNIFVSFINNTYSDFF